MSDYAYLLKYIMIGDSFVGKSCLLLQYLEGDFNEEHDTTIGVEFGSKNIIQNEIKLRLQIWDTAGQENFKSVIRGYYRSAIGVILVFDITKRSSFYALKSWFDEVMENGKENVIITIVANKVDDEQNRKVTTEEGKEFANQHNLLYIETSAKTGYNVEEAFNLSSKLICQRIQQGIIKIDQNELGIKCGNSYQPPQLQKPQVVLVKKKKECC